MKLLRTFALACIALVAPLAPAGEPVAPQQVMVMLEMPPVHFRADGNYSGGYSNTAARAALRRVANEIARTYGLRIVSEWPMPVIGVDCYVMEVAGSLSAAFTLGRLSTISTVTLKPEATRKITPHCTIEAMRTIGITCGVTPGGG